MFYKDKLNNMATELGQPGYIPSGNNDSVEIPTRTAPDTTLRVDDSLELLPGGGCSGTESYKFLASSSDTTPGYLSEKINTSYFGISSQELVLIGFGDLTTDDLT